MKEMYKNIATSLLSCFLFAGCCTSSEYCTKANDDPVYVLCRFDLKQGRDQDYVKAVNTIVEQVRAEKGCRFYTLVGDADTDMKGQQRFGKDVLWMIECWDDLDSLKAHLKAPHMKAFAPTARSIRHTGTFHVLKERK
jgi:quinol monooxygenase YgiN